MTKYCPTLSTSTANKSAPNTIVVRNVTEIIYGKNSGKPLLAIVRSKIKIIACQVFTSRIFSANVQGIMTELSISNSATQMTEIIITYVIHNKKKKKENETDSYSNKIRDISKYSFPSENTLYSQMSKISLMPKHRTMTN